MNEEVLMVSICCTTYNHRAYIRDCLEGFVNQKTNFKFEVLVHDDASTDGTQEIIKEYERKYPDIIKPIYQTENQFSKGVLISRIFQYPRIQGKYYAMCEGDDYWCDENKLQKQVDFLEKHPDYSACVHNVKMYNCTTNKVRLINPNDYDYDISLKDIVINYGSCFHTSSVVAKKEFYLCPKEFKFSSIGDYPRAIYLAVNGKIHYFKDVMSVYRVETQGSWSFRNATEGKQRVQKQRDELFNVLSNIDKYYNFLYHDIIVNRQVSIMANSSKYREIIKNKEYRNVYIRNNSFKKNVLLVSACIAPKTVEKYFKRKNKIKWKKNH